MAKSGLKNLISLLKTGFRPVLTCLLLLLCLTLSLPARCDGPFLSSAYLSSLYDWTHFWLMILALVLAFYLAWNIFLRKAIKRKTEALDAAQRELDVRNRTLQSLLELGYTLSGTSQADSFMSQVIQQIRQGIGFDRVGLYLIDKAHTELRGVIGIALDGSPEDNRSISFSFKNTENPMIQVALGEKEFYLTDNAVRDLNHTDGVRHNAFVPLRATGHILGVLTVDNFVTGRPFGETEVRQLRGFADEIALALYNARLLTEAEEQQTRLARSNKELQALVEFSRMANNSSSPEELAHHICVAVNKAFGFDRTAVFLWDDGDLKSSANLFLTDTGELVTIDDLEMEIDKSGVNLFDSHKDFFLSNRLTDENSDAASVNSAVPDQVLVPLRSRDEPLAVIVADNAVTGRPINSEDIASLVSFGKQAATALQSIRLVSTVRASEERLRDLVTSLAETLYSVEIKEGAVVPVYFSPQLQNLIGYSPEEALKTPYFWLDHIYSEDRERVTEALPLLENGEAHSLEYRIVHRDGDTRWVLDTPAPIRDESGTIVRINGTIQDITDRKQLEKKLRQAQKLETVGTLAGGIAHDFNNLLAIISGNIQEAKLDVPEDNPAQHSLSQTLRAVNRAADLIKQILTFSRETPSRKGEASIQAVIDETVPLLQSSLGKNIVLDVRSDSEVRSVLADSLQIQQILINLCVNARDAMPEGGTITVRAQNIVVTEYHRGRPADARPGNYVRLQVRDRGIGMDTPTQERIFMPFFTTKPVGQGTGLGLSVTYGIVAEHRGWIEVDSAPGAGTAFSIYLPALEGEAREEVPEVAPGRTVLISEADHELRQKLVEALEDRGYYTLAAEDNSEALALFWAEADHIDLVICDGSSPGMEVGQLMRNLWTENEDVKILTTIPETAPRRTYTSPFGSEVSTLQKPFTPEQMVAAIEKLLTVGVGRA